MTVIREYMVLVGISGVVAFLAAPIISKFFCVRPVPAWMRHWRDVAMAIGFARIVYANLEGQAADYVTVVVFAHVVVAQLVVAAANWYYIIGRNGDRCRERSS